MSDPPKTVVTNPPQTVGADTDPSAASKAGTSNAADAATPTVPTDPANTPKVPTDLSNNGNGQPKASEEVVQQPGQPAKAAAAAASATSAEPREAANTVVKATATVPTPKAAVSPTTSTTTTTTPQTKAGTTAPPGKAVAAAPAAPAAATTTTATTSAITPSASTSASGAATQATAATVPATAKSAAAGPTPSKAAPTTKREASGQGRGSEARANCLVDGYRPRGRSLVRKSPTDYKAETKTEVSAMHDAIERVRKKREEERKQKLREEREALAKQAKRAADRRSKASQTRRSHEAKLQAEYEEAERRRREEEVVVRDIMTVRNATAGWGALTQNLLDWTSSKACAQVQQQLLRSIPPPLGSAHTTLLERRPLAWEDLKVNRLRLQREAQVRAAVQVEVWKRQQEQQTYDDDDALDELIHRSVEREQKAAAEDDRALSALVPLSTSTPRFPNPTLPAAPAGPRVPGVQTPPGPPFGSGILGPQNPPTAPLSSPSLGLGSGYLGFSTPPPTTSFERTPASILPPARRTYPPLTASEFEEDEALTALLDTGALLEAMSERPAARLPGSYPGLVPLGHSSQEVSDQQRLEMLLDDSQLPTPQQRHHIPQLQLPQQQQQQQQQQQNYPLLSRSRSPSPGRYRDLYPEEYGIGGTSSPAFGWSGHLDQSLGSGEVSFREPSPDPNFGARSLSRGGPSLSSVFGYHSAALGGGGEGYGGGGFLHAGNNNTNTNVQHFQQHYGDHNYHSHGQHNFNYNDYDYHNDSRFPERSLQPAVCRRIEDEDDDDVLQELLRRPTRHDDDALKELLGPQLGGSSGWTNPATNMQDDNLLGSLLNSSVGRSLPPSSRTLYDPSFF